VTEKTQPEETLNAHLIYPARHFVKTNFRAEARSTDGCRESSASDTLPPESGGARVVLPALLPLVTSHFNIRA
jgi:hypothetical protein